MMTAMLISAVVENGFGSLNPIDLRCEFLVDPIGIDAVKPRLSWKLQAADPKARALSQSSYRILVASGPQLLKKDYGDLWDSGKVSSADTDLVALRFGFDGTRERRAKLAMTSQVANGDGTFTRVFEVSKTTPLFMHFHTGWFNMGVEAMTKATLYDDQAPYTVSWWGIPYRIF